MEAKMFLNKETYFKKVKNLSQPQILEILTLKCYQTPGQPFLTL